MSKWRENAKHRCRGSLRAGRKRDPLSAETRGMQKRTGMEVNRGCGS